MKDVTAFSLFVYCVLILVAGGIAGNVVVPERLVPQKRLPIGNSALAVRDFANPVEDPSFEIGDVWTDVSERYGYVRCDGDCTDTVSAYDGEYYLFFGGSKRSELATVSQEVTFPIGTTHLRYFLKNQVTDYVAGQESYLYLKVKIGEEVIQWLNQSNSQANDQDWTQVSLDINRFADGNKHEITFEYYSPESDILAGNYYVDLVSVVSYVTTGITTGVTTGALTTGLTTGWTPTTVCYHFDELFTNYRRFSKARVFISDCKSKSRDRCERVEVITLPDRLIEKQQVCIPPVSCSDKNVAKFGGQCVRVYDVQVESPSTTCKNPVTSIFVPLNPNSFPAWNSCYDSKTRVTGSVNPGNTPVFGPCSGSKGEFCLWP